MNKYTKILDILNSLWMAIQAIITYFKDKEDERLLALQTHQTKDSSKKSMNA